MLFTLELSSHTTGAAIFETLNNYVVKNGLKWECCVGICTDGAAAMTGHYSGVTAKVKGVAPKL